MSVKSGQLLNKENLNSAFMSKVDDNNIIGSITANGNVSASTLSASSNLTVAGNATITGTLSASGYNKANWDAAYTHRSSTGADHTYINQSVTTAASPTFAGLTITSPTLTLGTAFQIQNEGGTWWQRIRTIDTGVPNDPAFLLEERQGAGDYLALLTVKSSGDLVAKGNIETGSDIKVPGNINFFNGTTQMGDIGSTDASWFRINQSTAKNIYTVRGFRSDGGIASGPYSLVGSEVRADIFRAANSSYYLDLDNTGTSGLFAGSISIGSATAPTDKLTVTGDARINGKVKINADTVYFESAGTNINTPNNIQLDASKYINLNGGRIQWAANSATPTYDVNLYRYGANILKTDDNIHVAGYLTLGGTQSSHKLYVNGTTYVSGVLTSGVATGTAPLSVTSTTAVSNLNADMLDGFHASTTSAANTIVAQDASADINCRLVRSTYANQATISGAMAFRTNNSSDNYIRFCSDATAIRTFIGAAASSHAHSYLPLTGGTLSGPLTVTSSTVTEDLTVSGKIKGGSLEFSRTDNVGGAYPEYIYTTTYDIDGLNIIFSNPGIGGYSFSMDPSGLYWTGEGSSYWRDASMVIGDSGLHVDVGLGDFYVNGLSQTQCNNLPAGDGSLAYWQTIRQGRYFCNPNTVTGQPSQYGILDVIKSSNDFSIMWHTQASGSIFRLSGNSTSKTEWIESSSVGHGHGEFMQVLGWVSSPGVNADTMPSGTSGFTYSNNAPCTGPVVRFQTRDRNIGGSNYDLQLNASYGNSTGDLAFRTHNGDSGNGWNPWRTVWHTGNLSPLSNNGSGGTLTLSNWIRTTGSTGWYSQTYGGGWYMTDSDWIRNYNNKHLYMTNAIIRTDGYLQVGDGGQYFHANSNGTYIFGQRAWHVGNVDFAYGSTGTITSSTWTWISFGKTFSTTPSVVATGVNNVVGESHAKIRNRGTTGFEIIVGGTGTANVFSWIALRT